MSEEEFEKLFEGPIWGEMTEEEEKAFIEKHKEIVANAKRGIDCYYCGVTLIPEIMYDWEKESFYVVNECPECGIFYTISEEKQQEILAKIPEAQLAQLEVFYLNFFKKVK